MRIPTLSVGHVFY